ncbi:glycosyltransferase [Brevibacterium sediminis]
MLDELAEVAENTEIPFTPIAGKVLTILHASAPDQSGGYAVRAHSVLKTIVAKDFEVTALTRPGFPEAANSLEPGATAEEVHDGIRYLRLGSDSARANGEFTYMREAIDHFAEVIRRERPSAVHLRSTYVSALPGLIAAKRFGLPVVYEVSGMWELVYEAANTARMEGRRARTVVLENAVLEHCDEVVTITEAMREIISGRVRTRRPIGIMPNAVDTTGFTSAEKNPQVLSRFGWSAHDPVIGYIGTFVGYEGLDILVRAIAIVRSRGLRVRALLVGDGAESARIRSLAADLSLDESTIVFTGRVPHEEVSDLYSVIDVCAYPRLLTPATRAVSPLKPFEAMAAKKSVIVSDVPALAEIAGHGERGLVVPSGDVDALAEAISTFIKDPTSTRTRVEAAAAWTESERSWSAVGAVMGSVLDRLMS